MAVSSGSNDGEPIVLAFLGVLIAPTVVGALALYWNQAVDWALTKGLLVPASSHPLLGIPATAAGLDLPRVALVIAVGGVLLLVLALRVKRAWRDRQEIQ